MRDQIIPDSLSSDKYNNDQRPGKFDSKERVKNPKFTGFFQGQANLNTSRVAGYYYNACARVSYEDPLTNQALEDETGLLNWRIQNYDQVPPPIPQYPTYRNNQSASKPRMTRSH